MEKTIEIPEGYEARIDGNKVIIEKKEDVDEKIRRGLLRFLGDIADKLFALHGISKNDALAYLEKQKEQKPTEWSEEDKEIMHDIIKYHYDQGEISSKHNKWASWLEHKYFSLQSHWEPSKKQMEALKVVARGFLADDPDAIDSLLTDLQKLL